MLVRAWLRRVYQGRNRAPSARALADAELTERIKKIHAAHGGRVGVRRVRDVLARCYPALWMRTWRPGSGVDGEDANRASNTVVASGTMSMKARDAAWRW